MTVLAFHIDDTDIRACLVQCDTILARRIIPLPATTGGDDWLSYLVERTTDWRGRYDSVGLAVSGMVQNGASSAANPVEPLSARYALTQHAQALFGVPVTAANDAQAAAWGEYSYGAGIGHNMAFVTIGTGISGGLIINGHLWTGRSGLAGHFGQWLSLPQDTDNAPFENSAAGRFITRNAGYQDSATIFARARDGDAQCRAAITLSVQRVARLLRNLQYACDPDIMVIGGGIGLAEGYVTALEDTLSHLPPALRPTLRPAALGVDAGLIGIAALVTRTAP